MYKIIVLDTHIWYWWINQAFDRFPHTWQDKIASADKVAVSPVSCYEIAVLSERERISLPCSLTEWLHEALQPASIELLPISTEIAIQAVKLSPIHKDPFDRIIIATALVNHALLASIDSHFPSYPELKSCLLKY